MNVTWICLTQSNLRCVTPAITANFQQSW